MPQARILEGKVEGNISLDIWQQVSIRQMSLTDGKISYPFVNYTLVKMAFLTTEILNSEAFRRAAVVLLATVAVSAVLRIVTTFIHTTNYKEFCSSPCSYIT